MTQRGSQRYAESNKHGGCVGELKRADGSMTASTALFPLGKIVSTTGALQVLEHAGIDPLTLLDRHVSGDWGTLDPEDQTENRFSVEHGFRIFSSYLVGSCERIWVITEADRASTCLLCPHEY